MLKLSLGSRINTKLLLCIIPSYTDWQYTITLKFMGGDVEMLYYPTTENRQEDLDILTK